MTFSRYTLLFCIMFTLWCGFNFYPKWKHTRTEATISWDASGYYMYLPAVFIYKDIKKCGFKDSILARYYPTPDFQQASALPDSSGYVMKYSSGQALLMAPFFAIGHQWARNSELYPADGFSYPYQKSLGVGMLLYTILGLIFFRKNLAAYFSETVTSICLICLVIGTNYFNFAVVDQAMTHNTLFTLYCILIWQSIRYYRKATLSKALWIGFTCGFMTLIRPTEIISIMIPLLWGIDSLSAFKNRWLHFRKNPGQLIMAGIAFIVPVSVQLFYWKYASGHWLYYSYDDQGFSFLHPHLKNYILSYQSGWLVYCPMMVFALAGMFFTGRIKRNIWPGIITFSLVNLYIVASWDIWWYGGRAMIQSYAILFFPFAAITEYALTSRLFKYFYFLLITLFCYINVWWTWHAHFGSLNLSAPTKAYFWRTVGRWNIGRSMERYLDNSEWYEGNITNPKEIYRNDFEQDTTSNAVDSILSGRSIQVDPSKKYSNEYFISGIPEGAQRLRLTADVTEDFTGYNSWEMNKLILRFYSNDDQFEQMQICVDRQIYGANKGSAYIDADLRKRKFNKVSFFLFNDCSGSKLVVDNVRVITFDEEK